MKNILRYSLSFLVFLAGWMNSYGQELETLLRQEGSSNSLERKEALIALSHFYDRQKAYAKANEYWAECLDLEKANFGKTSVEVVFGSAESLFNGGQYHPAILLYRDLLKDYKGNEDSIHQYTAWMHLIIAYEKTGQFEDALEQYSLILTHFSISKNPVAFASQLNHMGIIEKERKDFSYAFDYFTNARAILNENKKSIPAELQLQIFSNLAVLHAARKEYLTALGYFQSAEDLRGISNRSKAHLLNLKGATYLLMGRYEDSQRDALFAANLMRTNAKTLEEQQTLADSYDLLSRMYKERDWPTYQQYHGEYLAQRERINQIAQLSEQEKLLHSIEIEKKESEIRISIANTERMNNEVKRRELESESANRSLELKVRDLEVIKQNEELNRFQLEKQLLIRRQAEQQLLLVKQRLETENQQKELDRQTLVQERGQQELKLVKSQNQLIDRELEDTKQRGQYVTSIGILGGAVVALLSMVVVTLLRNRKKLIQNNTLISKQKQEIENQNEEIRKTIIRIESAQLIIETQNKKLTSYNETLEQQVTERTEQLVETNGELRQNNQQLEQYSYMTAHNLRGPIARLLGLTSIFHKLGQDTHQEIIDKVQKEASALDTLIKDLNQILQVRKATEELSQQIDIAKSFKQAIVILESEIEESGSTLVTDFSEASSLIFVPTYFENIIYNLVSNAIKYRHQDRPLILSVVSAEEEHYVTVEVADNGLGIDLEKNKDNIFGLYKRFHFHRDGKGIGLYLIKAQLETLGGNVQIESKVGTGTKFKLFFPKESLLKTRTAKTKTTNVTSQM